LPGARPAGRADTGAPLWRGVRDGQLADRSGVRLGGPPHPLYLGVGRASNQCQEGDMVQRLTDSQQPLLTATYAGRLGLPQVGHALATFSRRYPVGLVAALVLLMIALLAVLAPLVTPYDP